MRIETYKGIEFVRISAMPKDQQALIHSTFDKSRIITILCEHELLRDCIQVADYEEWTASTKKVAPEAPAERAPVGEFRLAFK